MMGNDGWYATCNESFMDCSCLTIREHLNDPIKRTGKIAGMHYEDERYDGMNWVDEGGYTEHPTEHPQRTAERRRRWMYKAGMTND